VTKSYVVESAREHLYFLHLTSLWQFVGVKNDRVSRNGSWCLEWPAAVNRDGETIAAWWKKRNVEIKVFASYLNAICGACGMNRMSFVGLKRVGGGEI